MQHYIYGESLFCSLHSTNSSFKKKKFSDCSFKCNGLLSQYPTRLKSNEVDYVRIPQNAHGHRPLNEVRSVCLESIEQLHYHPRKRPVVMGESDDDPHPDLLYSLLRKSWFSQLCERPEADQSVTKVKAHSLSAWRWEALSSPALWTFLDLCFELFLFFTFPKSEWWIHFSWTTSLFDISATIGSKRVKHRLGLWF